MAKVTGPLFSMSASGNLKSTIIYSKSKCVYTVKGNRLEKVGDYHFRKKTLPASSNNQRAIRECFSNAITSWKNLSEEQKAVYVELAKGKPVTAVSLYVQDYINANYSLSEYLQSELFSLAYGLIVFSWAKEWQRSVLFGMLLN